MHTTPQDCHTPLLEWTTCCFLFRLALQDIPDLLMEGAQWEKAKECCKTGKKALEKLMRDCKTLIGNLPNKQDDLFADLILIHFGLAKVYDGLCIFFFCHGVLILL